MHFHFATRLVARLRTPFLARARRIRVIGSRTNEAAKTASATTLNHQRDVLQLMLFAEEGGKVRRQRTSSRKKARVKGKQYRLKMSFRSTPRKIAYRPHASKEESVNTFDWSDDGMRRLHSVLLSESLLSLRAMCEKKSVRAAEIIAWMTRGQPNETFSFEECCRLMDMEMPDPDTGEMVHVGQQDPEVLRHQAKRLVARAYGASLPHAQVLREGLIAAESGDPDAIAWILSDQTTPLSFLECIDALGFDAEQARSELRLPTPAIRAGQYPVDPIEVLDRDISAIIDRVFGHSIKQAA